MEDNRLADTAEHRKCPTCPDYQWHMPGTPADEFHCARCTPHCLQIGHTNGQDPDDCERAHQHRTGE